MKTYQYAIVSLVGENSIPGCLQAELDTLGAQGFAPAFPFNCVDGSSAILLVKEDGGREFRDIVRGKRES